MNLDLENKTVLVSGSTGGIGQEIAASFAREKATVIVNGRTANNVESAIEAIRKETPEAKLLELVADLGTKEGCDIAINQYPEIDVLVNNLGIYEAVGFFDETDESWYKLFEVNIMSGVRLSRYYLKKMLGRNSGRIVFISSESALNPAPEMAHYSATKAMQLSISRSLAELTKGTRVTVNSILPGSTKTDSVMKFIGDVFPGVDPEDAEKKFVIENRPTSLIQRLINTVEIADFVTFVCSDRGSAISGAALRADGGIVKNII
jgi:3-oxoacyl-[acyl-carrier protein] reductase